MAALVHGAHRSVFGMRAYRGSVLSGVARHAAGMVRPENSLQRSGLPKTENLLDEPTRRAMIRAYLQFQPELSKPRRGAKPMQTVELLLAGPPAFEAPDAWSIEEIREWARESLNYIRRLLPDCAIAVAELHLDENSPHIHIILVPMVRDASGKLRLGVKAVRKALAQPTIPASKKRIKGQHRDELSRCAAAYWHHVNRAYGIEAPVRGSSATHVPVDPVEGLQRRSTNLQNQIQQHERVIGLQQQTRNELLQAMGDEVNSLQHQVRDTEQEKANSDGEYILALARHASDLERVELETRHSARIMMEKREALSDVEEQLAQRQNDLAAVASNIEARNAQAQKADAAAHRAKHDATAAKIALAEKRVALSDVEQQLEQRSAELVGLGHTIEERNTQAQMADAAARQAKQDAKSAEDSLTEQREALSKVEQQLSQRQAEFVDLGRTIEARNTQARTADAAARQAERDAKFAADALTERREALSKVEQRFSQRQAEFVDLGRTIEARNTQARTADTAARQAERDAKSAADALTEQREALSANEKNLRKQNIELATLEKARAREEKRLESRRKTSERVVKRLQAARADLKSPQFLLDEERRLHRRALVAAVRRTGAAFVRVLSALGFDLSKGPLRSLIASTNDGDVDEVEKTANRISNYQHSSGQALSTSIQRVRH